MEISNGSHSLFVEDIEEKFNIKKHKKYDLYIQDFNLYDYEIKERNKINGIFNSLALSKEEDELIIHISSNGGYIPEYQRFLIGIKNFRGKKKTILENHGYSCGAFVFLSCKDRHVYQFSQIMFHNYSGGIYGKGNEIKEQADFSIDYYRDFMRGILSPYFSKKEIEKLIDGKDYWMGAEEMLKRGIATKILKC